MSSVLDKANDLQSEIDKVIVALDYISKSKEAIESIRSTPLRGKVIDTMQYAIGILEVERTVHEDILNKDTYEN